MKSDIFLNIGGFHLFIYVIFIFREGDTYVNGSFMYLQ